MKKILLTIAILLLALVVFPYITHAALTPVSWIRDTVAGFVRPGILTDTLRIPSLTSCDTIDTDADGDLACGTDGGGGGGSIILDLADNGSNESSGIAEIATTGDTNSIFTEPTADKFLIAVGNDWPKADLADALAANGANCSAGNAPLGVDASGAVETCTDFEEDLSNSAGLASALSNETGTSLAVFNTLPTFAGLLTGNGATGAGFLRWLEDTDNGSNYLELISPSAVTSNQQCVLENDSSFIPDSCVGNGSDANEGVGTSSTTELLYNNAGSIDGIGLATFDGTNLNISSAILHFKTDATTGMRFITSGITTGQIRDYTAPDATGTVALGTGVTGQCAEWTATNTLTATGSACGSGGSTDWDTIGDPSTNGSVAFGGTTQTITGNTNDVTAIAQDMLSLSFTNDAATDILTQRGLVIQNEASANGMEAFIALNNNDADDVVTSGLIINSGAGGITTALDVSDSDIVTALDVGSNNLDFGSAGVRLTGDADGAITFLGQGNGSDEDLTLNLDDTSNTGVLTSSTGLNNFSLSSIGQTITIANTQNITGLTINQNDSTNLSPALSLVTTGGQYFPAYADFYNNFTASAGQDGDINYWRFYGNDSGGNKTQFAALQTGISDNTNGSEDGYLRFTSMLGGTSRNIYQYSSVLDRTTIGSSVSDSTLSSNGNNDFIFRTGNSTTGTCTLQDGANGDFDCALNGTGRVELNDVDIPTISSTDSISNKTIPASSNVLDEPFCKDVTDEYSNLTTGDKINFRMPFAMTLTAIRGSLVTAGTGATLVKFDVEESNTTIFSTEPTFDASETTTVTAATAGVISDASIADDAVVTLEITAVGNTTTGKGLKICFYGTI